MDPYKPKKKWRSLPNGENWNQAAWKEVRHRAIHSLEPYCAECHKWIDITLPMVNENGERNLLSVEVDHKIPISRGGPPYELTNLQLTHMRCNRKKGAKMRSDYDGLEAANPVPISNQW